MSVVKTEKGRVVYDRKKHEFLLKSWIRIFAHVTDDLDPYDISGKDIGGLFHIFATLGYFFLSVGEKHNDESSQAFAKTFMFRFLRRTYSAFFGEEMPLPESYTQAKKEKPKFIVR